MGEFFLPNQVKLCFIFFVSLSVFFLTWHSRLGHPFLKTFRKILLSMNILFSSSQFQKFSCNLCNINTSHKLPFYASSISSTSLLEVVYYDVSTSPILFVDGFKLTQREYFVDLLSKHNMLDSKLVTTPLSVGSHVGFNMLARWLSRDSC